MQILYSIDSDVILFMNFELIQTMMETVTASLKVIMMSMMHFMVLFNIPNYKQSNDRKISE
jgi:hypothetical protein